MLTRINYLTAGESHGKGLLGIIDGLPAGLEINEEYIAHDLFRRQQGHGRGGRMKIENDYAEIYTGVRHGKSLGSPIGLILPNKDWTNWTKKMSCNPIKGKIKKVTLPRPGHADLAGIQKYDSDDIRNILERSSARETAMRVALASICRKFLSEVGIEVCSRVVQIHTVKDETLISENISLKTLNKKVDESPVRCLDKKVEKRMIDAIDKAKNNGEKSITGVATYNVLPFEVGQYFNKVDCFCFENQTLEPGEEVLLPVNFYIDPKILEDPSVKHLNSIVLSYTFFQSNKNFEKISKNKN